MSFYLATPHIMMKSPYVHSLYIVSAFVLSLICLSADRAPAQWGVQSDSTVNRLVCDTNQAGSPQACSDGKNGAIIVWQDTRGGGSFGVFAQHLDSNGREMWVHNGISVCRSITFNQQSPIVCTDDSGGAYVAWQDSRNVSSGKFGTCIFAQHVKSNGTLAYPDTALPLVIGKNDRKNPVMCDDGRGGAYLACEDYRNANTSSQPDIYMNRLRPASVKFSIDTSLTGVVSKPWMQPTIFHDSAAHFHTDLVGDYIWLLVSGHYTRYQIGGVNNDTTLVFSAFPLNASNISYYIEGPVGKPVDTVKNKQTHPAICNDGTGGCVITWQSGATIPTAIYAKRVDSSGTQLWNPAPGPGFLVFQGQNGIGTLPNASHVAIRRDGQELMLAWEVPNISSQDTQDIYTARIHCSTPTDTTQVWAHASDALSSMLGYQGTPQIFSDDSAIADNGPKGVLVVYENLKSGSADNWDVSMSRIKGGGDGGAVQPRIGSNPGVPWYWDFATQPHGQTGFQAVKIDVDTSILAVWNDSRYYGTTGDTVIFAQAIDKYGFQRYPSYHYSSTGDKRAKPICHGQRADGSWWNAKQVVLVPRTNGGIAVWQDFRKGISTPNIYSQLIFKDGSLPIELASFDAVCRYRGQIDLAWKTASEQANAGFEVQRRQVETAQESDFAPVASYTDDITLRGAGSSNYERNYAWSDRGVEPGIYEYRLVEVALDGTRVAHEAKRVDARYGSSVDAWSVGPNVPNPFAERTMLPIALPVDAVVDLSIFDVTGREIASPLAHRLLTRGVHEIALDRNSFAASNGGLMARVIAYDPVTGEMLWQSEKPVMMTVIH